MASFQASKPFICPPIISATFLMPAREVMRPIRYYTVYLFQHNTGPSFTEHQVPNAPAFRLLQSTVDKLPYSGRMGLSA